MVLAPPATPGRLVYLGTPEMAVPPLHALVDAGFDVALVVTRPDRRRGRGSGLSPSPVKAAAQRLGIGVGMPVAEVRRTARDRDGRIIYFAFIRYPARHLKIKTKLL